VTHTFSHFQLRITPVHAKVSTLASHGTMEGGDTLWYNTDTPLVRGLAAPIERLLAQWSEGRLAMARMVNCVKLGREAEGLDRVPYPGELGQRIYENVSKEAWQGWLRHQTMLINEYRLTPIEPKAREFLVKEMENYFFGEGATTPPDYRPE
jgi:Fe-S cluster biosynthesis and repair protein YggX